MSITDTDGEDDVLTRYGWETALRTFAARVGNLTQFAKTTIIPRAIGVIVAGRDLFHDQGVYIITRADAPVIVVELPKRLTGQRLYGALMMLNSPVVADIELKAVDQGEKCEVEITLKPRPSS